MQIIRGKNERSFAHLILFARFWFAFGSLKQAV